MTKMILASVFSILLLGSHSQAENWGHWRGPTGNGTAPNATPPTEWSSTKNVKWKVAIPGRGSGSPVIWGDKVFVVTAVPVADGNPGHWNGLLAAPGHACHGQGKIRPVVAVEGEPVKGLALKPLPDQ